VRQPPFTWELAGSWTYRSFHNNPTPLYQSDSTPHHLIWEGVFKLESPTSTTLQGADEPLEGEVQRRDGTRQVVLFTSLKGTVRPDDASFRIVGTNLAGLESFYYQGHLTRNWPNAVDQRPALVGSHIRAKREGSSLPALSNPFIAVKRRT
jgi:hypothetical protein